MKKMKRLFLMMFAIVVVAITGCSQNKQNNKTSSVNAKEVQENSKVGNDASASDDVNPTDGKVNYLTTADFKKKIMDYEKHTQEWVFEGDRPVVIDFYATWCGPCKRTSPVVEELAKEYQGKIVFYKVDVDKEQELAAVFGIQSVPTFLFIPVKGNPTAQMGAMQKADFEEIIKSVILK